MIWGSFEQPVLFLELDTRQVAKKVMVTLVERQNSSEEMGDTARRTAIRESLLTDRRMKIHLELIKKKHLKETERNKIPWSDETKQFGLRSKLHIWKFATCVVTH